MAVALHNGLWLKKSWGGEVHNVSILIAIEVNHMGYREVLGVYEGIRKDKESWSSFLRHLKERGLKGIRLVTSDLPQRLQCRPEGEGTRSKPDILRSSRKATGRP